MIRQGGLCHCSHLAQFELLSATWLAGSRRRRLLDALERTMGVEEISLEGGRIVVMFHPMLVTPDDLGELMAKRGCLTRRIGLLDSV